MRKKFKQFLNEVDHSGIDPFGEEIWDDNNLSISSFMSAVEELGYNPSDILDDGDECEYFTFELIYPRRGKLEFLVEKNDNTDRVFLIMLNVYDRKFLNNLWTTLKEMKSSNVSDVFDTITFLAEQLSPNQ